MGYTQHVEPLERLHKDLQHALALVHAHHHDAVDLHHGLWFMDYYRLPMERVWKDTSGGEFAGRRASYLSPELNFIHVALHHLVHAGWMRDWLDMLLLVTRSNFQWDRLVHLARSLGVVRPIYWIVKDLAGDWELAVPDDVTENFGEYTPHWLEDPVIRSRIRYAWRFASRFQFIEGWPARLAYLRPLAPPIRTLPGCRDRNDPVASLPAIQTRSVAPSRKMTGRLTLHTGCRAEPAVPMVHRDEHGMFHDGGG